MGRRQTLMTKYKIQMRALRKMRAKVDNTPYYDDEKPVYLMDTRNPVEKIPAKVIETTIKRQRKIIKSIECPLCTQPMEWDNAWEAFKCKNPLHGRPKIYEIVR